MMEHGMDKHKLDRRQKWMNKELQIKHKAIDKIRCIKEYGVVVKN